MPELPECERGRRLAEEVLVGRRIVRIHCADDRIVIDGTTPARVRKALRGRHVLATRRHGKQIWFELDERPWPLFHFGMTGSFRVPGAGPQPLASSPRSEADGWPPRFVKLRLVLDDGGELAYVNSRRLGRIRLREDPRAEPPVSTLGFDPLLELPTPARFERLVRHRRATLKGLLLDQGFAAGVGNWIADEVLYQARLDPRRRAETLDREETRRLRTRLSHVIRVAVGANADKGSLPRGWLFHRRWGRQEEARTARGEPIRHETIAGRTTAWVPSVQS